jgi:hypothetical protein
MVSVTRAPSSSLQSAIQDESPVKSLSPKDPDGLVLGEAETEILGLTDGDSLGLTEGLAETDTLGLTDGLTETDTLGETEGDSLGPASSDKPTAHQQ